MAVACDELPGRSVVVLTPEGELLTAEVVGEVQALGERSAAAVVVLDLASVHQFVSGSLHPRSEPIGPLLSLRERLQQEGRRLVLCGLDREVSELFRVTQLDRLLEVQRDLETVLVSAGDERVRG